MPSAIVSDTSCLILFYKIGELDLLKKLFGKLHITDTVLNEFNQQIPEWIEVVEPTTDLQKGLSSYLDKGEASAIALAAEYQNSLLIIDEIKGRKAARELLKENEYEYVSADDIAYELNPEDPLSARLEAGKKFFKRLDRFANDGTNLLIESTLSGKSLLNVIAKFQKELGYTVSIVFIFLDSEAICIERIQTRVKKGGHPVPKTDVVRRFGRSIVNFWNEYRPLSDRWVLYYNTEDSFQEVAHHPSG